MNNMDNIEDKVDKVATPIIATIRTGLTPKDDAIMDRVPVDYDQRTVAEVVNYLLSGEVESGQVPLVAGLQKELDTPGVVVSINGKRAGLHHPVARYLQDGKHDGGDGVVSAYRNLEIEVTAVQQGGYR